MARLRELIAAADSAGSPKTRAKRAALPLLAARQRIELLADPGSFAELDQLARHDLPGAPSGSAKGPLGDGVVTGTALVDGRTVAVFAQDFAVLGGSMGETHGRKIGKVMNLALKLGCPVISMNDSGGARIQEGVVSLAHYAALGRHNARASGVVPQIALIAGPCAGGAVYSPALMDFTVMLADHAYMFVTGPEVLRAVTGEEISLSALGGAHQNAAESGNVHYVAQDEADAMAWIRGLLSYLPANSQEFPEESPSQPPESELNLNTFLPDSAAAAYDVRNLVRAVVDGDSWFEVHELFAPNIVCGFARIAGQAVGVVANQPQHLAGTLDINASEKAARFVRFCDCFNLPLVTLVDVPGYLPGVAQEQAGMIRRGAKLLYAYAEASVPMITVVTRKAYGGAYAVMGSQHIGADLNFAWPTAEIAVMGEHGAVSVIHAKELAGLGPSAEATARQQLAAQYRAEFMTPYAAAERGYLDAVIEPSQTRERLTVGLKLLRSKRTDQPPRRHGNGPA